MQPDYQTLQTALQSRLDIIGDAKLRSEDPAKQLQLLQEVSEAIVAWHLANKGNIPGQLHHFLSQQSLSKALDYLKTEGLT